MKHCILLVISLLLAASCSSDNPSDRTGTKSFLEADSLDLELTQLSANGVIPGFAVAFVDADGPIFQKSYGYSNKEQMITYQKETIQLIASVSKTFIGVALMQLVEKGQLDLDDPINKFLPFNIKNPFHPDIDITFRMLATHTSSIDDYDDGDGSIYWLIDPIPEPRSAIPEDVLSRLEYFEIGHPFSLAQSIEYALTKNGKWYDDSNFAESKPGTESTYSNIGASLAAYLIEIISGQSFEQYTKEHIFKPLTMDNTAWHYRDLESENMATTYITYELLDSLHTYPLPRNEWADYPDGHMLTNIIDLSRYISDMIKGINGEGKLLSPTGYKMLFSPKLNDSHFPDGRSKNIFNDGYNYGVFWARNYDSYIMHNGFDDGVTASVMINPKTGIGTVVFSNIGDNVFGELLGIVSKWEQKMHIQ